MAYAVKADVQERITDAELVKLTDDAGSGAVDDTKITAALNAASATIDAYAGSRHDLPLTANDVVKGLAVDLAIYELEKRRRKVRATTLDARDTALKLLRDVSMGRLVLNQDAKEQTAAHDIKTPDRTDQDDKLRMGDDNLEGY